MYKNPPIKVEWEDTPENHTKERVKRVIEYFKVKYNTNNVKLIPVATSNSSTTKLKSLDVSDNILDPQYQKKIVKEFIKENGMVVDWDMVNRLDDRVNEKVLELNKEKVRYNKWYIRKIEFSNFLSFGENNVIDFEDLDGITVVESTPRNFGGKTSATVDLLMFLFFNTTTKSQVNGEVFNLFTDVDEVKVKGYINIDGLDYVIERNVTRKKSKSGEYKVSSSLTYTKILEDGTIVDLTEEQRRVTEPVITSAIGTQEDFLATILTTGRNLEDLIDSKPTARGLILARFLGLESLKQKEEICKDMYNDWSKKLVSNIYNVVKLENENKAHKDSIETSEKEIVICDDKLIKTSEKIIESEKKRDDLLSSRHNDVDQDLIRTNTDTLKKEIETLKSENTTKLKLASDINVTEPSKYYNEDDHEKLKKSINDFVVTSRVNQTSIDNKEKLIKQFEEGSICPTCHRPLEGVDHTEEINGIKKDINDLKLLQEKNLKKQTLLESEEKGFTSLSKEYDEYERNKLRKAKLELEIDQNNFTIDSKVLKIKKFDENKKKLEDNQRIDGEVMIIRSELESLSSDIRELTSKKEKNKNIIVDLKSKIEISLSLIKKIKSEEEYLVVFRNYLTVYGKNGISKTIMKNMVPLLNQELHRVLMDTCYFTLELNVNEKNELEFLMIDNESRVVKPLYSGSGYEKTASALAIRSVLTKVSSLPKPNIVVMDEIFGKVADENLEMIGEFFKKIKNYFEHILVISHNPLIRNWSDNLLKITKEDNISSIEFIKTKIS